MKRAIFFLIFGIITIESYGQLVRRKDYDAAFALQAGGGSGILTTFHHPVLSLTPTAGLKMTFPFTRKWFLGSEINYEQLKYKVHKQVNTPWGNLQEKQKATFDLKQVGIPVYLKYMLNCNKASLLFGIYGSYTFDARFTTSFNEESDAGNDNMEDWNAGIVIGYEHRLAKHLNVMCRINAGVREVVQDYKLFGDKLFPVSACLTLSYDILRIGDCGCD